MKERDYLEKNLEENALDSLVHGIEHFINFKGNNDLKYAILHIAQSVELFLKARLAKEHYLLIFSKPENCTENDKTVTLEDTFKRLVAIDIKIPDKQRSAFNEIQKIRNRVQHYQFKLSKNDIKNIIGRTIKHLEVFLEKELNIILKNKIKEDIYEILVGAIYSYDEYLQKVENEMKKYIPSGKEGLDYKMDICQNCGNITILYPDTRTDEDDIVECFFCKQEYKVDECIRCGQIIYSDDEFCFSCWNYIQRQ